MIDSSCKLQDRFMQVAISNLIAFYGGGVVLVRWIVVLGVGVWVTRLNSCGCIEGGGGGG